MEKSTVKDAQFYKRAEDRADKFQLAASLATFLMFGAAAYFAFGWGGAALIGAIFCCFAVYVFGEVSKKAAKLRKENSATNEYKKGPCA